MDTLAQMIDVLPLAERLSVMRKIEAMLEAGQVSPSVEINGVWLTLHGIGIAQIRQQITVLKMMEGANASTN